MKAELEEDGEDPLLLFVQLESFDANAEFIETKMEGSSVPILQDTKELDIWGKYNSLWPEFDTMYYHVVIIDASGCIAAHFGPVVESDLEGPGSLPLKTAWREALHTECSTVQVEPDDFVDIVEVMAEPVVEPVDEQDVQPDPGFTDFPDVSEELIDLVEADETSIDIFADESSPEEYIEPFQLQETCQVEPAEALQPGQKVPHFLCMDVNPSSSDFGEAVSDQTLKDVVWLAYYGSCT